MKNRFILENDPRFAPLADKCKALYHGTTATAAREAAKFGLCPRATRGDHAVHSLPEAVYLSEFSGFRWAAMRAQQCDDDLGIIQVNTSFLNPANLALDEDVFRGFLLAELLKKKGLTDAQADLGLVPNALLLECLQAPGAEVFETPDGLAQLRKGVLERRGQWVMSMLLTRSLAYLGTVPPEALRVVIVTRDAVRRHGMGDILDFYALENATLRAASDGDAEPPRAALASALLAAIRDQFDMAYLREAQNALFEADDPENAPALSLPQAMQSALKRFVLGGLPRNSPHGPEHWQRVELFARHVAQATPGADETVCRLFAMLHDAARENDGHDPQHGPKAAKWAREALRPGILAPLSKSQFETLCEAIEGHTRGYTTQNPTVGACWDADRLDLTRPGVEIEPDPARLSTQAARETLAQAKK